jgi:hypothetical protein
MTSKTENEKMIFQVKSGSVGDKDIRALVGAVEQHGAAIGTFLTLKEPTRPMVKAAHAAGVYRHPLMGRAYDKIRIVTIKEMLEEGARLEMPLVRDVLKAAERDRRSGQQELDFEARPVDARRVLPARKHTVLANPKAREIRRANRHNKKPKVGHGGSK